MTILIPLRETRADQEIFAEGVTSGEAKSLKRLLTPRFGSMPDWVTRRIDGGVLSP
ncbi:hypothetical protein CCP3SC1_380013 [Gammaproteobacteria bacterium]